MWWTEDRHLAAHFCSVAELGPGPGTHFLRGSSRTGRRVVCTEVLSHPAAWEHPEKGTVPASPLCPLPRMCPPGLARRELPWVPSQGLQAWRPSPLGWDREEVGARFKHLRGDCPAFSWLRLPKRQEPIPSESESLATAPPAGNPAARHPSCRECFPEGLPKAGVLELESPPWAWGSLGEGLASSHVNRLAVSLTPSKAYCTLLLAMFLNHSLAVTSPPPKPPPHYLPPSKSLGLRYPPPGWKSLMVSMAVGPSAVTWTCPPRCVFHFLGQAPTAPLPQLACERLRPRGEHGPLYNIVVPLSHSPFWLNHPGSP